MLRSSRLRKGLVILLLVALASLAVIGCARLYLTSRRASRQIADKLQTILGAPVDIKEVDVGINSGSSLSGLQVFEANGQPPEKPWLTVEKVRVDLSALDVVGGDMAPQRIVLSGATIDLRFDDDGRLVTALPKIKPTGRAFPQLVLERSQLTLAQAGREPMVIRDITAEASDQGGDLVFRGTVHDKDWGDWTADGSFKAAEGTIALRLTTPYAKITQGKLDSLPFVSPSVWQQVHLDGESPVDLELHFTLGEKGVHYKIDLTPTNTTVDVTSINLHADDASGHVTVEDRLVLLRDVKGRTADGTIMLPKADLDFRSTPTDMTFDVAVSKVDLHKLPETWDIKAIKAFSKAPMSLTGQVHDLRVRVLDGKPHTTGDGAGTVQTVLLGQQATIRLALHADGEHFHFKMLGLAPRGQGNQLLQTRPPRDSVAAAQPDAAETGVPGIPLKDIARGLRLATTGFFNLGAGAMAQVDRWTNQLPAREKTEYLEASVALKDVDVEELLREQNVQLPFAASGKVSLQIQVAVPIDTPSDTRAYKMRGSATSSRLNVAGVEMTQVSAKVTYDDGVLSLDEFRGQFADSGGAFDGGGKLQWAPQGDLTLRLRVDRIPMDRVLALLPGAERTGSGTLSGRLDARVAVKRLRDPSAWEATGTLSSERLGVYGLALAHARLALKVKDGVAAAHDLDAELEGGRVTGGAEVRWADGYPYKGRIELKGADLAALQHLSPNLRPALPVEGRAGFATDFQGKLAPLSLTASGTARAEELTVAGVHVEALSFHWTHDADRVQLTDVAANLYDGSVTGSATLPLKAAAGGDAHLVIEGVEVLKLVKVVPFVPVQLEGRVFGTVSGALGPAAADKGRELTAQVDLNSPRVRVAGFPAEKLRGRATYSAGLTEYRLDGELLGGRFELEGKRPPTPTPPDKPPDGRLRIEGAHLSRLGAALGLNDVLAPLSGKVDVDLPYRHDGPSGTPTGVGRFALRGFRWADGDVAETIQGDLRLTADTVQLRDVSGNLGEGSLRGALAFHFQEPERSWFNLQLDHVEAARLLAPFVGGRAPAALSQPVGPSEAPVEGALDVHLRGNLGREWRATGDVALTHGKLFGIEVNEWRLPVSLSYSPRHGTGQLDFNDNNAQLARGRTQGRASLRWGSGLRLAGTLRFFDVDLPTLLRSTGTAGKIAGGRMSGRLDFAGDNIHSLDDLTGTLEASFAQAQALQLPVLDVLARNVAPGQAAMTFEKGDARATLSRGVVRVNRLALSNATLQMLVEGTVTVQGRVDLEATASTGTLGINPNALRLLGARLPAVGPVPLATVAQASAYLSNRVVHLRVTGTVKNPSVHLDPVPLLTDEAIRFFLGAAVGAPAP